MNKIKDICNKDNILQDKLKHKEISQSEYNYKISKIHKNYTIATKENELLRKLLRKHGGN